MFTGTLSLEGPLYLPSVTFLFDVPTQAQLLSHLQPFQAKEKIYCDKPHAAATDLGFGETQMWV